MAALVLTVVEGKQQVLGKRPVWSTLLEPRYLEHTPSEILIVVGRRAVGVHGDGEGASRCSNVLGDEQVGTRAVRVARHDAGAFDDQRVSVALIVGHAAVRNDAVIDLREAADTHDQRVARVRRSRQREARVRIGNDAGARGLHDHDRHRARWRAPYACCAAIQRHSSVPRRAAVRRCAGAARLSTDGRGHGFAAVRVASSGVGRATAKVLSTARIGQRAHAGPQHQDSAKHRSKIACGASVRKA